MVTNDIIAVSRVIGSRLAVSLEGQTRANKEAKKIQEEFDGIPYLQVWSTSFSDIVYARVIKVITPLIIDGPSYVVVSTLPVSTNVVHICMLEITDKVTVVKDEELKAKLFRNDKIAIEKPLRQLMEENLQAVFPDRWEIQPSGIVIHFPEIEISNGVKKHKIYDIFARLPMNSQLVVQGTWEGMRMTLSRAEVMAGYRHSHLNTNRNHFSTFCLGDTVNAEVLRNFIGDPKINMDYFLMCLHQLDAYIRWESVEGGPYIRMKQLSEYKQPSVSSRNFSRENVNWCMNIVRAVLHNLVPADIETLATIDGSSFFMLKNDGQTALMVADTIRRYHTGSLYNFDSILGMYPAERDASSDYDARKRAFLSMGSFTFRGQTFTPKILGDDDATVTSQYINLPSPEVYRTVIMKINMALNDRAI